MSAQSVNLTYEPLAWEALQLLDGDNREAAEDALERLKKTTQLLIDKSKVVLNGKASYIYKITPELRLVFSIKNGKTIAVEDIFNADLHRKYFIPSSH